jgi:cyanophycin synthetase
MAVTGSNGATTSRMIAHILATAGKNVGMTTSNGMYIGSTRFAAGDQRGPESARKALRNPAIDTAVLETSPSGILSDGLGFDQCDVAVVTNVSSNFLDSEGTQTVEERCRVVAVITQAVSPDGASVLNADDECTVRLAATAHGEIIFFSLDEQNPVIGAHLLKGGKAVVLRQTPAGEMLTLRVGGEELSLLLVREIPGAKDERIDRASQNAMAAIAATIAQNVPLEVVRTALCSFSTA